MSKKDEVDDKFKKIADDTAELIKQGKFKEVLRAFKKGIGEDDPILIGAMKMIANGMKAAGNKPAAHQLYNDIYDLMVKQGGENQIEVVKALIDVISTSSNLKTSYELTIKGLESAAITGDKDLIESLTNHKVEIFKSFSDTQRRVYRKLENNKNKKKVDVISKPPAPSEAVCDIDALMSEFGLTDK
jgi:hypothetical protein